MYQWFSNKPTVSCMGKKTHYLNIKFQNEKTPLGKSITTRQFQSSAGGQLYKLRAL